MKINFAPNALFQSMIEALHYETLNENEEKIKLISNFLTSHYSDGTILGEALKNKFTLEDLKNSNLQEGTIRIGIDRVRNITSKTPYLGAVKAYTNALTDAKGLIKESPEPTTIDRLFLSWISDNIVESLEMENQWISENSEEDDDRFAEQRKGIAVEIRAPQRHVRSVPQDVD
jgi:hypothetical protein